MKTIEEMTFEELVEWAEGNILKELIAGKFHHAVWSACEVSARWHEAQERKAKKK